MSLCYSPSIGGIETASRLLAEAFKRMGHNVVVATMTADVASREGAVCVERRPTGRRLIELVRWSDVVLQNNVHLRQAWPLAAIRRPCIVTTQTWIDHDAASTHLRHWVKWLALKAATNVFISDAVRRHVGTPGSIIPNPYDAAVFRRYPDVERGSDIIFLGRLVSDKGADLLLRAVARMIRRGDARNTTVVGEGPERRRLEELAKDLGIDHYVSFKGAVSGEKLGRLLAEHKVMVVPSRWAEPFGIVALEGLACGCVVVVSNRGGLPEAVGECGTIVDPCATEEFAHVLTSAVALPESVRSTMWSKAEEYLRRYHPDEIAKRYLEIIDVIAYPGVMAL